MDLKCIKPIIVHWGIQFTLGAWYSNNGIETKDVEIILNPKEYHKRASILHESAQLMIKGHTEEELYDLIPGYMPYNEFKKKHVVKIGLDFYNITDNMGIDHYFCRDTKQEIFDKYNSCSFTTTVHFVDDFFESRQKIRERNINLII